MDPCAGIGDTFLKRAPSWSQVGIQLGGVFEEVHGSGDPQNIFMQNSSQYIAMRIIGESPKNQMGSLAGSDFRESLEVEMVTPRIL
jgi:hypothetical protein